MQAARYIYADTSTYTRGIYVNDYYPVVLVAVSGSTYTLLATGTCCWYTIPVHGTRTEVQRYTVHRYPYRSSTRERVQVRTRKYE